jgi:hypothetical protein
MQMCLYDRFFDNDLMSSVLKVGYLSRKFAALLFGRHWTTINLDAVIPSLVSV